MKVQLYQVAGGECLAPAAEDLLLLERGGDHVTQFLKWATLLASLDISKSYVDAQDALFVKLDGSRAMTGALVLANDPMNELEAATKRYVDIWAGEVELELAGKLSLAGGTLLNPLVLSGDPTEDLHAASKHYVDVTAAAVASAGLAGKLDLAGGIMTGELLLYGDPMVAAGAATKQYVDNREQAARDYADTKLAKAGGEMSGPLILTGAMSGDPFEAVARMYVDGAVEALTGQLDAVSATAAAALPKAGGTMLGTLLLAADPAQDLEAATKQYVDTVAGTTGAGLAGKLELTGGTMTGELLLYGDPMIAAAAATKQYVDNREQAARDYADTKLAKAGGEMSGPLILTGAVSGDPFEAVAKLYVDGLADGLYGQIANVNATASAALPKAGGTMTGALVLAGDPAQPLEAATKQYVDSHASAATAGTTDYAANLALDFNGNSYQTIALAGDLTISGTNNRGTAKSITIRLVGDGSARNLTFPASWRFFGMKPATLAANKEAILSLTCFGANETDVRAAYSTEQ